MALRGRAEVRLASDGAPEIDRGSVDGPDRAELAASWEAIQDWNSAASSPPTRPFSSCLGQRWLKIRGVRAPQRGHSSMGMK